MDHQIGCLGACGIRLGLEIDLNRLLLAAGQDAIYAIMAESVLARSGNRNIVDMNVPIAGVGKDNLFG